MGDAQAITLPAGVHPWVAAGDRTVRFGIFGAPRADWSAARDWVLLAERLGFDSFWASDHPTYFTVDCWTLLAALAVTTTRIRLGSLVSCVLYRGPTLLARMAADVDRMSQGRLLLGLGIGDHAPEFDELAIPFARPRERQAALEETIQIVRGLWGESTFTFTGAHFQVRQSNAHPGPLQQPRVPLLIAGGGEHVTLRQVGQYADASNFGPSDYTGSAFSLEDVERKLAALRRHCAELGRPPESILPTHTTLGLLIAESARDVRARLGDESQRQPTFRFDRVAGTPDEVTAYFAALVAAGMRYFILNVHQFDVETLHLLAERVVPALADA
jgi:alkanesulfonate monooxygenase SsuD/methylene tetrahydromethanopterin reductase-like flavin-dependent oxidoreductase (luciferase family)